MNSIIDEPLILDSTAAAAAGETRIGGKAWGLAKLAAISAAVPPWVVLSASAFAHFLDSAPSLRDAIKSELAALSPTLDPATPAGRTILDGIAERLSAAILATPRPERIVAEVTAAVMVVGPGPVAVRSSMIGEDSAAHSFAGQLDTFLYRRTADDVLDAVARCWASAFSARSLAYRIRTGQTVGVPEMGVVIQRMITGTVSGVMFTAHPISGRRDRALITAAWGLGEGIVNGTCDTDEYVIAADTNAEVAATIATKTVQLIAHPDTLGTIEAPVSDAWATKRCLPVELAQRLAAEGRRIAAAFGAPQDIEWTFEGETSTLFVLQARPITALPAAPNTAGPKVVWDNSNIQESYCGVTTPLTFSFAQSAYASVYAQTMRALGLSSATIAAHRATLQNMLGLIRGRVYYNIDNWYRLLLLLPSFGRNKADMEKMMGLEHPVDFIEDERLTGWQKLARLPRLFRTVARLVWKFRTLPRDTERFMHHVETHLGRVNRADLPTMDFSALVAARDFLHATVIGNWHTPIVNDIFVMSQVGSLRRWVRRSHRATANGSAPNSADLISTSETAIEATVNALLGGEEGIESVEPTRMLMRLARLADGQSALEQVLRDGDSTAVLPRLQAEFPAFFTELQIYLERYGDRVMGELKLETISAREDAGFVLRVLRNFLGRPDLDPDRLLGRERELRAQAERTVQARLGPWQRRRFRRVLRNARFGIKAREKMRMARTRVFGLIRDVYRAIGSRLVEAGQLDEPREVFFLAADEITAYHDGRAVTADLRGLVRVRRAEFAAYETMDVPNQFSTIGPVYHGNDFSMTDTDTAAAAASAEAGPAVETAADGTWQRLRGLGCSAGRVEAELCVIVKPTDDLAIDGRILTTLRTDPGWAPLFPAAAAVLIERGSTLSHSAVLARELGIPAVVGVPNLLKIVHHGDRARLDGDTGIVERLP